jgi:hypothetical protein
MKIKGSEQEYNDWKAKQSDAYGQRIFSYAEDWVKLLEARIPAEATDAEVMRIIVDHAEADSHTADTDGITGFMYGAAVAVLAKCWEHGEQLRRWHNLVTQVGNEGEKANESGAVLNPALLNIE